MLMAKIYLRKYAHAICDKFEDLLDKHDISIPDPDRQGGEDEDRLYGSTYYDLEDEVYHILTDLCVRMIKAQRNSIELDRGDSIELITTPGFLAKWSVIRHD